MRSRTVIKYEGELLGPVDWSFDFHGESTLYNCTSDTEKRRGYIEELVTAFRRTEDASKSGAKVSVCVDGYWKPLLAIGMYDGWPYWKPYPSVCVSGVLGAEWHPWWSVRDCRASFG